MCKMYEDLYLMWCPLICFCAVEFHLPHRVARQFGLRQEWPVEPFSTSQVSVFELLYTLLNIIEYLKQTVREKGKDSSNTIYAFCTNSELIANLFNYCTQLNRVLTVEDSMHRTSSNLLTEHHQNAHCIILNRPRQMNTICCTNKEIGVTV